ncbi:peptidoglycan-binding protein [Streptomyces sp. I05A-00742]|uniref:peptidoglycan-binding domain-containing protein n=1 Tax=Streptomyces sp. I05A-00742 TaxID=2732853 RepID=UPI0014879647|nr:peptidoglycan-binding protein [Streptomyces sp. I05A-00742]
MRPRLFTRALVGITAVVGLAAGSLAGAGAGFAASAPTAHRVVSSDSVALFAVENLGLSAGQAQNIQCWLRKFWSYPDAIDGQLGTSSWQAYQRALKHDWGYTGAIDGIVGSGTVMALQRQMRDAGWGYTGPIDGVAGPDTRAAFKRFADACEGVCRQPAAP